MRSDKIQKSENKGDRIGSEEGEGEPYKKGRGAQVNTPNKFLKNETSKEHIEAIDDWEEPAVHTQFIEVEARSLVNKVDSPDVGMFYALLIKRRISKINNFLFFIIAYC